MQTVENIIKKRQRLATLLVEFHLLHDMSAHQFRQSRSIQLKATGKVLLRCYKSHIWSYFRRLIGICSIELQNVANYCHWQCWRYKEMILLDHPDILIKFSLISFLELLKTKILDSSFWFITELTNDRYTTIDALKCNSKGWHFDNV